MFKVADSRFPKSHRSSQASLTDAALLLVGPGIRVDIGPAQCKMATMVSKLDKLRGRNFVGACDDGTAFRPSFG
tara:strand:+ start:95 stop:316 length:222 start_codon:yes stop_codon:yes gene_type:complete